jgi:hypothetical protein
MLGYAMWLNYPIESFRGYAAYISLLVSKDFGQAYSVVCYSTYSSVSMPAQSCK